MSEPISYNWVGPEVILCLGGNGYDTYVQYVFGPFANHLVTGSWKTEHDKTCNFSHIVRKLNEPKVGVKVI